MRLSKTLIGSLFALSTTAISTSGHAATWVSITPTNPFTIAGSMVYVAPTLPSQILYGQGSLGAQSLLLFKPWSTHSLV